MIADLKAANVRRESEARILADQVAGLKEQIPRALETWKQGEEVKIEEVRGEVSSLKKLLQNRLGATGTSNGAQIPNMGVGRGALYGGYAASSAPTEQDRGSGAHTPSVGAVGASGTMESQDDIPGAPAPGVTEPKRESVSARFGRSGGAAIPAWQMAAKKNSSDGGSSEAGSG